MDHNVITGIIVGGATIIQQILKIRSDRQKAIQAKIQHDWDLADRAAKNKMVLEELHRNTQISVSAFEVGATLNQKLLQMDEKLDAIPDTAKILDNMLKVDSAVSPADIGRVLIEMKRNADDLHTYAHRSVHRLNNLLLQVYSLIDNSQGPPT